MGATDKRYWIETWGCQMNLYDSNRFSTQLERLGWTAADGEGEADLILLNTCSVREKAAQKMFSRLGRLAQAKRERPELVIGVAGCVAQQEKEQILTRAKAVDFVVGTRAVGALPELLDGVSSGRRGIDVSMHDDRYDEVQPLAGGRGRSAWVTIVEGCNKACSFCIVPFTRGAEVNRAPAIILDEVGRRIDEGVLEIELLGQNVNAYRHGEVDFASLLRMVDRVAGLERLRFTTSHPRELTDDMITTMAESHHICNHLHLPVQSGSNRVLKRMYRGYDRERYLSRIRKLRMRIPDIAVSTDMIVGFPGETEEDFLETMRLIDEVEFDQIFAFVYSPRPHTRAEQLDDPVPKAEKDERLQRLLARQDVISRRHNLAMVGRTVEVLLSETDKPAQISGRTRDNHIVHMPAPSPRPDGLVQATITRALPHSLQGELAPSMNDNPEPRMVSSAR